MKNTFLVLALGIAVLSSCKKEETPIVPTQPTQNVTIEVPVNYEIYAASGSVEVTYLAFENGVTIEKTEIINRMNHSISFKSKADEKFSIKARNTNPSHDEVIVTVVLNGNQSISNSTTELNAWALVSGTIQ